MAEWGFSPESSYSLWLAAQQVPRLVSVNIFLEVSRNVENGICDLPAFAVTWEECGLGGSEKRVLNIRTIIYVGRKAAVVCFSDENNGLLEDFVALEVAGLCVRGSSINIGETILSRREQKDGMLG